MSPALLFAAAPKPGVVIFAKDVPRVARFYQEVFGLVITHADGGNVVLESAAVQLVIHSIPAWIARDITVTTPPELREDCALKLFLPVARIADARAAAAGAGGAIGPPAREWSARGFRACDGHDPEGDVIQVREADSGP